ncbi:hypothetical protein lerEdw1_004881 [Lerista edwardsae]|nr:hypothetical protein lerEdw1_004881 [Lerista edwardsae]
MTRFYSLKFKLFSIMVFFLQTSNWALRTLLKKHQTICPISRLQPPVSKCFVLITSRLPAKSVDPKATGVGTASLGPRGSGKGLPESRARRAASPPRPFNLFAAGASKRRAMPSETPANVEPPSLSRNKSLLCPPEKPLSAEEWEQRMGAFEGTKKFEDSMLEQMIACSSPIDVAKSLLAAVARRDGDIRYSTLVKYLVLCVSQKQVGEIYDVYDIMKARFKTLDTSASGLLIKGLSSSQRWREALSLLEEVKKVITPSKGNYGDCIRGALLHQEINLACELFHEMLAEDLVPNLDTLQVFFDTGKSVKDDRLKKELFHILSYLRDNQVYPGEAFMESIKQWFESIPGENWKGNLTTIKNSGQCPSCNQYLENINLSPEEYNILKEKIIKDVIQGMDTFRKTTPEELEQFQMFVKKRPPFDIVIDGLNVARVCNKNTPSQTVSIIDGHQILPFKQLRLSGHYNEMSKDYDFRGGHSSAALGTVAEAPVEVRTELVSRAKRLRLVFC